jgi:hypothetical protein
MKSYFCGSILVAFSSLGFAFQQPGQAPARPKMDAVADLGGLKSQAPADWKEEQPDDPRYYKQYRLEPIDDDKDPGQVTIAFVNQQNDRAAKILVRRWQEMFLPPEGQTIQQASKLRKLSVHGAEATYLDIRGDLKGIPGDDATPRQDYRLLGVYLNTPKGPCLIRVLGPNRTVEYYRNEFESWVKGFK